jgi:glycerophosphoryl diester phosphodiesterase
LERIGHRGAPRELAENSLEGFLRAVERGADAVELDAHRTRDGVVVVHHDPDVVMPGGWKADITSLSSAEIAECRLTGDLRIPTLAAVMDALGDRAMVYVELKGAGVADAALEVAGEHGKHYAFHSFDHQVIRDIEARKLSARLGILIDKGAKDSVSQVRAFPGVRDIWVHWTLADAAIVGVAHAQAQRVIAWTVNASVEAERLATLGVDGVCTDDVRLLGP